MHQKQLHIWLEPDTYDFLVSLAKQNDESISRLLRRLIRQVRQHHQPIASTSPQIKDTTAA